MGQKQSEVGKERSKREIKIIRMDKYAKWVNVLILT